MRAGARTPLWKNGERSVKSAAPKSGFFKEKIGQNFPTKAKFLNDKNFEAEIKQKVLLFHSVAVITL